MSQPIIRRALDRIRARFALLILAFGPLACSAAPAAKAPTVLEAATVAINLTDEALAAAIDADTDTSVGHSNAWLGRVVILEAAARAVRTGEDACTVLPTVGSLAAEIKCKPCAKAVDVATRALGCRP